MFGIGNLFDPMKMMGTSLFGGPQPIAAPTGGPAWGNLTPPGGKPPSLLQAGNDDMQPPPTPGGGQIPLTKGGSEGAPPSVMSSLALGPTRDAGMSRGLSIGAAPPVESSAALHPAETAIGAQPSGRVPESTLPMTGTGAGITTPSQSPQYAPTPPTALETGGAGGNIRSPYDAPAAAPAPAGPAAAPGGGAAATPVAGAGGAAGKLGDIGKALSAAGGQQAGKAAGFAPGGVGAAHTPDGSALMQAVMKLHPDIQAGPVPGLPAGLLQQRFRT